ncbi:MAG: beta-propeller fold lactonase family protein [Rhizobacter sp.]
MMNSDSTRVYVSNADSRDISVLRLDERSGELSTLQTVATGGIVGPLSISPDQCFLYAARRNAPFAALAFRIDSRTGQLARLGEAPLPTSMVNIAVDGSGRWLFSASYGDNQIAVSALDEDGLPQPTHQVIPTEPKAHAICSDPSNRFVFAISLGGGLMMQFRFDAETGRLAANDPPVLAMRTEAGPRHLVFHPHAPFVYVINELDASLDVLALDRERGTLSLLQNISALPPVFSGEPWAAELRLTPDGRFLYTCERRSSTLAGFAVNATTGTLTPLGHSATQTQPRGFAITASGLYLIAAGQLSHRVGVHAIDVGTGALTLVAEHDVGKSPIGVETIQLT